MTAATGTQRAYALVEDSDLAGFLDGLNDPQKGVDEPQERVRRNGVPDHRAQYRISKTDVNMWASVKDKIIQLGRIRAKTEKFNYRNLQLSKDLPQIRLLRVHQAKEISAPVVCDLIVVDLDKFKNKYEALSYCWGDGQPEHTISIRTIYRDGENSLRLFRSEGEEFPVRWNLLQALKHLRKTNRAILLWVDAICINQRATPEATAEKNEQLSMMSRIYNSARNVCIWFENYDDSSRAAFQLLQTITNFNDFHENLHNNDTQTAMQTWSSLVETLKTTRWFSRRWIIQEIASARNASVHCGSDMVHWDDLAVAISLLDENSAFMHRHFNHTVFLEVSSLSATLLVKALTNVCRKTPSGEIAERLLDFETLVCTFQRFEAKYPQDVIHSVRALAKDEVVGDAFESTSFTLAVDTHTSTRDLFIKFVKRCIALSGSLDIICRHWAPIVTDSAGMAIILPSWISELSNCPFGLPGQSHERQNGENFLAMTPAYRWKQYSASGSWTVPYSLADLSGSVEDRSRRLPHGKTREALENNMAAAPNGIAVPSAEQSDRSTDHHPDSQAPLSTHTTRPSVNIPDDARPPDSIFERIVETYNADAQRTTSLGRAYPHRQSISLPEKPVLPPPPPPPPPQSRRDTHRSAYWTLLANLSFSPYKFPELLERQRQMSEGTSPASHSSKTQQESYEQVDKEHNTLSKDHELLPVKGIKLGVIEECSDIMRGGIVPGDWLTKLGWQDSPHKRVPDQVWRLLVADRTASGGDLPEWYSRACLHCLKDSRFVNTRGDFNSHKELSERSPDHMTSIYLKRVESVVWRRRIVRVKVDAVFGSTSVFALAPERTTREDLIYVLAGCSVPVVLRRIHSDLSDEVFKLIGETYVHGMMNGEAIQSLRRAGKFETSIQKPVLQ